MCFARFWSKLLSVSEPPSQKKPHFLHKNGQKMPFCSLKQCFWGLSGQLQGPIPYFQGAGLKTKVFCKGLEQIIKDFRAAITKKNAFWPKMAEKRPFFGPKQCLWGLSGHR